MRTLNQTGYWSQGARPRKWVKVSDAVTGAEILTYGTAALLTYEDRIEKFGTITQRVRPEGGLAEVSGVDIDGMILDDRLTLCTEAEIAPNVSGSALGSGRLLAAGVSGDPYATVRNGVTADWATPAIVIGRNYSAGSDIYTIYRGLFECDIPAGLTTCESAWLELTGMALSAASNFGVALAEGNWSALSVGGAMYNDFENWAAGGTYAIVGLGETWTTAEYGTTVRIRLNAAGRALVVSKAGSALKLMLLSDNDVTFGDGPTAAEYVMFESGSARLNLRYNSTTLDNQVVEIFYGFESAAGTLPSAVTSAVCDLVWSGVVDSYALNGRRLSLSCKQNDHKKNRMVPDTLITLANWPNCPETNIGKAVPVVYGEFALSEEHRAGVAAYPAVNPAGTTTLNSAYPDCLRGLVVVKNGEDRTVLFSGHALRGRTNANHLYKWNSGIKAYEILPCRGTRTADANGDYTAITQAPYSGDLPDAITSGFWRSASAILPARLFGSTASNPAQSCGSDVSLYATFDSENEYIDFTFPTQPGMTNTGAFGFVAYGNFTSTTQADMHLTMYENTADPEDNPSWSLLAIDITPWGDDGVVSGWIARYFEQDLTKVKIRLQWKKSSGTPTINRVCVLVPVDAQDITEIYSFGQGRADDGTGTITGVASALIENPSHVIEAFAENEMALTASNIDLTALDTLATDLTGLEFAFQLVDRARARELLDDLAAQAMSMAWWDEQDRLTVKKIDDTDFFPNSGSNVPGDKDTFSKTGAPSGGSFTQHPMMSDLEIEVIGLDEVKNDFVVKYKKNMASNEFEGALTCDKDSTNVSDGDLSGTTGAALVALCDASYDRVLTVNTEEVEAWAIRVEATAARLLQHLVEWKYQRRYRVRFTAAMSALECEFGDFYTVSHDRLDDLFGEAEAARKKWMVIGKDVDLNRDVIELEMIEV